VPARKKIATWSTISSVSKRSPVSGSAVVMILVARSSGAVPASISAIRAAVSSVISRRIARAVAPGPPAVKPRHPARQRHKAARFRIGWVRW
jgi:hypothetical protein